VTTATAALSATLLAFAVVVVVALTSAVLVLGVVATLDFTAVERPASTTFPAAVLAIVVVRTTAAAHAVHAVALAVAAFDDACGFRGLRRFLQGLALGLGGKERVHRAALDISRKRIRPAVTSAAARTGQTSHNLLASEISTRAEFLSR